MGKKSKLDPEITKRPGIKQENPEKYYEMDTQTEWIGEGKFARVVKAKCKSTGTVYAAKCIKYDSETLKFAVREYDIMVAEKWAHPTLVKFVDAFIVQKYLVLIMDYVDGENILKYAVNKGNESSLTEDDIATFAKQVLTLFSQIHADNFCHLDIRPTNIKMEGNKLHGFKLLDYNSCKHIPNKKAGAVVDNIGDTEFCAPELLSFDPVQPASDMWSLAVIIYILLCGTSPFYHEFTEGEQAGEGDEDKIIKMVQTVKLDYDLDGMETVTSEVKDFLKKIFVRAPEMRLTNEKALEHAWLSDACAGKRKKSVIESASLDRLDATNERLNDEEEEDYIIGSFVFREFAEEEYESPDEDEE